MVKGSIFLALLILFWESSAMIVKFIFTSGKEVPFENPLFLTYISSSLFVLYLVPLGIKWMYLKRQKRIELAQLQQTSQDEDETLIKIATEGRSEVHEYVRTHKNPEMGSMLKSTLLFQTMTEEVNEVLSMTWKVALMWMAMNFCYNYGLMYSSITTNMVLNNSCPMWVWLLSLSPIIPAAHQDTFSLTKGMMLWLLMLGFAIISYQDVQQSHDDGTILGNTAALFSAILYAVYSLYLKIKVPADREDKFRYTYLLGFVGLFNLVVILPVLMFLHSTHIETFTWPDSRTWLLLFVNAFVANFLWDYCFLRAVSLLGPLITNTGLCLSFPVSLLIDIWFYELKFTWMYFIGSACVITAFSVIMFMDRHKEAVE